MTLTETRIDLADRHTTLYHLNGSSTPTAPLPLGSEDGYQGIYAKVLAKLGIPYSELCGGVKGTQLDKFFPIYKTGGKLGKKDFWRRYLGRTPGANDAWSEALPLKCRISQKIGIAALEGFTAKISAVPYVLLYPFGWSVWISVLITGAHTLMQLRQIVVHLVDGYAFSLVGEDDPVTMSDLCDGVAEGVRVDAFDGESTMDTEALDVAVVTTVLAKYGGSISLNALSKADQDEENLRKLVRPTGQASKRPLDELVTKLDEESALNYMVIDKLGRFTWMDKLLIPGGRNHQWLECYHHNSFLGIVQAWHWEGLVAVGKKATSKSKRLKPLLQKAADCLKTPPFRNASVLGFSKNLKQG